MQIYNQYSPNQLQQSDRPLELKQGEVYYASIKERLSDNEAIVQIRGKEIKAVFEGKVPAEDRGVVQVSGQKGDAVLLKSVSLESIKQNSVPSQPQVQSSSNAQIFQSVGITSKDIPELKQSVQMLLDKNMPVTKETVQVLRQFFEKASGSPAEMLNTVKALANKRLEVTNAHLQSIHEALHGKPLHEVLTALAREIEPSFELRETTKIVQTVVPKNSYPTDTRRQILLEQQGISWNKQPQEAQRQIPLQNQGATSMNEKQPIDMLNPIQKAAELENLRQSEIMNTINKWIQQTDANQQMSDSENWIKLIANLINEETTANDSNKQPSTLIKEALKMIQKEANLTHALDQLLNSFSKNANLDVNIIRKVEQAAGEAAKLLDKGRELGARQHLTNILTEIEQELAKQMQNQNPNVQQKTDQQKEIHEGFLKHFEQNEQFQTLPIQTKNILVTKVTAKLAQATHDFRELKREITRNLDSVERFINILKKNAYPQAKQMLEATINKLDNAILKSDVMLYTDMKTEKQLLHASTQLADAKKLLAKGNHAEAAQIVQQVKTLLEKINFKPSEQKVFHYVAKESMNMEQGRAQQQLLQTFEEASRSFSRQEPSARQMYEIIRSLGLNHDSELARSLVSEKGGDPAFQQKQEELQQNLKAVLLKLAQTGGEETTQKVAQLTEQALTNLTGQQLLSKADGGQTLQSLFFSLPLLIGERPENLQVFVNSKNKGHQVDWENCSLYFLIETKKLGDVGIMLTSIDRNLSITIKNDKPGFKEKMEPLASMTKEKLQELGYQVNSIQFAKMTTAVQSTDEKQHQGQTQNKPVIGEKGMDFKI